MKPNITQFLRHFREHKKALLSFTLIAICFFLASKVLNKNNEVIVGYEVRVVITSDNVPDTPLKIYGPEPGLVFDCRLQDNVLDLTTSYNRGETMYIRFANAQFDPSIYTLKLFVGNDTLVQQVIATKGAQIHFR